MFIQKLGTVQFEIGKERLCIFSQISHILGATGAWYVNEFCMQNVLKSTVSVKISEIDCF